MKLTGHSHEVIVLADGGINYINVDIVDITTYRKLNLKARIKAPGQKRLPRNIKDIDH